MRLELTTSAVTGRRSNQLSHWAILGFAPSKPHMKQITTLRHQTAPDLRLLVNSSTY